MSTHTYETKKVVEIMDNIQLACYVQENYLDRPTIQHLRYQGISRELPYYDDGWIEC